MVLRPTMLHLPCYSKTFTNVSKLLTSRDLYIYNSKRVTFVNLLRKRAMSKKVGKGDIHFQPKWGQVLLSLLVIAGAVWLFWWCIW